MVVSSSHVRKGSATCARGFTARGKIARKLCAIVRLEVRYARFFGATAQMRGKTAQFLGRIVRFACACARFVGAVARLLA